MNMSTFPSRKISHAIAWLLLAIAVAGAVRIASLTGVAESPDPASNARASKIYRESTRIGKENLTAHEAVEALMASKPGTEREPALRQALGSWAEEAPDDALAWVRRLDPGEDRDWLMGTALTARADLDASQAAALLEAEMPPGLARNHALVAIAQRWVQRAPEDAEAWLQSMVPSPAREDALREIGLISDALAAGASD